MDRPDDDWMGGDAVRGGGTDRVDFSGAAAGDVDAPTPDPAELRADIRDTRDRLGDTLEQIGERLNPRHIKEQVRDNIRDATIGRVQHMAHNAADRVNETRATVMDTIRQNPIPAAMVGIGLGWLFMNARQQGSSRGHHPNARAFRDSRFDYAAGPYSAADYDTAGYGGYASGERGIADRARDAEDTVRQRASEATDAVRDTASHVTERVQGAAHQVADRAQHVASDVAERTRTQARRAEDTFYDNPLAVGAATIALGLAAGLALPATNPEVQLMGDARDRLVDRAKDVAQETAEKVQTVASRVTEEARTTANETARQEGLTGGG